MGQLICTVDGFALPSTVRGWTRWSDDTVDPVSIEIRDGDRVIAHGLPDHARIDVLDNTEFKSGFHLDVGDQKTLQDILLGRTLVVAKSSSIESNATVWQHAKTMMLAQIVSDNIIGNPSTSISVFSEFAKRLPDDDPLKGSLARAVANVKNAAKAATPAGASERSLIGLAVGTPSADGSAILGRDGQLFLMEGSNNLLQRYDRSPENVGKQTRLAQDWISLIKDRDRKCCELGKTYLQLIVPEKTSVLVDLFPLPIVGPTECLVRIENACRGEASYLSVSDVIQAAGSVRFHRPTDTHPSVEGQFALMRAILHRFGNEVSLDDLNIDFQRSRNTSGDLSDRFFGLPILEVSTWPSGRRLEQLTPIHQQTRSSESGRTNTVTVSHCPDAPIDKTAVAFGNSVFNHGTLPFELSWWFSRLYKNFHFSWVNTVDFDYVKEIEADVVIAQTVERFLFSGAPET